MRRSSGFKILAGFVVGATVASGFAIANTSSAPVADVTSIETTEGETSWAILLTLAPVAPISTTLRPLGQLPLFEINNALVLLSTHALTTGTDEVLAIAKPLATVAPNTKPVRILNPLLLLITAP